MENLICTCYFTTDAHSNGKGKGIRYSIIDMSLAGNGSRKAPKGNVTKSKNKSLVSGTSNTERMTAVCHSNGRDYWLVTQIAPYGEIHSYLISGKTVSVKPVISKTPTIIGGFGNFSGQMKISPDGKKLALVNYEGSTANELFDFNSSTGEATNQRLMGHE